MEQHLKRKGYSGDNWIFNKKCKTEEDVLLLAPREVSVLEYAESHATEIKDFSKILKVEPSGQNVAQKVPRHMRRRAMGHDVRRLPRSIRSMDKNTKPEKQNKRPSRKHRRRPKNLLAEYTRRQRKHVWLETHIWHAKRFHMIEKWGCKIPWKPTEKNVRACYRASTQHCLIQDLSYMCCIELVGDQRSLLNGLSHLTSSQTGQTFAAVSCLPGTREGHTVLYHHDSYPWNPIGPVSFLWNPSKPIISQHSFQSTTFENPSEPIIAQHLQEGTSQRQLWIWCHPACWNQVWDELTKVFHLSEKKVERNIADTKLELSKEKGNNILDSSVDDKLEEGVDESHEEQDETDNRKEADSVSDIVIESKIKRKVVTSKGKVSKSKFSVGEPAPVSESSLAINDKFKTNFKAVNSDNSVTMRSLTGSVIRFRLTGPESCTILVDTLQRANTEGCKKNRMSNSWWNLYTENEQFTNEQFLELNTAQGEFMKKVGECMSPAELPPHCVFSLIARDPRVTRPCRREKLQSDYTNIAEDMAACKLPVSQTVCISPLWREDIRDKVTVSKLTDQQIHTLRAEHLVPGTPLEETAAEAKIPVIIIQRPGASKPSDVRSHDTISGQGSGFDILLPKGWAMPFWLGFVYRGARCGGLKELESVAYECRSLLFPNDFPDTKAGLEFELEQEKECVEKYNRVPPAKRVNYTKLNVPSPFRCPWGKLIEEFVTSLIGNGSAKGVGATGKTHRPENHGLEKMDTSDDSGKCSSDDKVKSKQFFVLRSEKQLRQLQRLCSCSLDRKVEGNNQKGNNITVDSILDEQLYRALIPVQIHMINRGSSGQFSLICIPTPEDLSKLENDKNYGGPSEPLCQDPLLIEKKKLKKELKDKGIKKKVKVDRTLKSLEEKENTVMRCGSRKVIGYLNSAGFSFGVGNGAGLGFVAALGLRELLQRPVGKSGAIVLVRSTASLQHRFARMSVLV